MTSPTTVRTIFEHPKIYEAPIFQRRYKWSPKKELADFWEDYANLEAGITDNLFLGAIITKPSAPSNSKTVERSLIVDGQQRLTTISLTILAAAVLAEERGYSELAETLAHYVTITTRERDKGRPRIIVTTPDIAEYESLFRNLNPNYKLKLASASTFKMGVISRAFNLAKEEMKKRILESENDPKETISEIVDRILDKAEILEVQLKDRHDPNEIFNRLNRKGSKLTVADLVRNHVFGKLAHNRELASQVYSRRWEPFEKELGEDIDRYFFPFSLIHSPRTTKARSMSDLEKRWTEINEGDSNPASQVGRIVEDLQEFVPAFQSLSQDKPYKELPGDVTDLTHRIYRMKPPSVILPFPMRLLREAANRGISPKAARECLDIVESFLVRRALVGLEATGLHAVFKVLWDRTKGDPREVRRHIESGTITFPSNAEVWTGIVEKPLKGRRLCHYILEERELSLRRGDPLSSEQLRDFEVDHIAPQSLKGDWAPIFSSEDEDILHTWSNLVPLSKKANSTKNAKSWKDARNLLRQDTVYKTTMQIYEDHKEWGPEQIAARSKELAKWAIERWSFYGSYV